MVSLDTWKMEVCQINIVFFLNVNENSRKFLIIGIQR